MYEHEYVTCLTSNHEVLKHTVKEATSRHNIYVPVPGKAKL